MAVGSRLWVECTAFLCVCFPFRIVVFHFSFDITWLAFHVTSKLHDFIIFVFHVVLILHMYYRYYTIGISCNIETTWFHMFRVSCSFDSTYVILILHKPVTAYLIRYYMGNFDITWFVHVISILHELIM